MNRKDKTIYLLVIASLLLPLIVAAFKSYPLTIKAQALTPANTYDYFKTLITKSRTVSPALTDKEELVVDCSADYLLSKRLSNKKLSLVCGKKVPKATATPKPTVKPTVTATTPSATIIPTNTTTIAPTSIGGTNPGNWSSQMGRWAPNTLFDTCTKEQHDAYNITGPDGKTYPTWHPATGPAGCRFGHEHGADPRTSLADNSMPAFGYVGEQMGMIEPHAGFKVFIINKGTVFEGKAAPASWRSVFHMGTAGVKRYTEQFHSEEFDYVTSDGTGRYLHTYGMADTGNGTGSTCTNPRDGGRDFSTVGCNDPYEIWGKGFSIKHPKDPFTDIQHVRAHIGGAVAAFDPILTRDPSDNTRILYSHTYYNGNTSIDPASPQGDFQGCARELYTQAFFDNQTGTKPDIANVYYTDVWGTVKSTSPGLGLLKQEIATVNSRDDSLFKYREDFCGNSIHAPN